jgi:hypothetical protein
MFIVDGQAPKIQLCAKSLADQNSSKIIQPNARWQSNMLMQMKMMLGKTKSAGNPNDAEQKKLIYMLRVQYTLWIRFPAHPSLLRMVALAFRELETFRLSPKLRLGHDNSVPR